jgi:hypothetical protein
MAGVPELVGLLYRADWTQLSLAAGVVKRTGAQPDDERAARRIAGRLVIAPGRRYRVETADGEGHSRLYGSNGRQSWIRPGPDDGPQARMFGGPRAPFPTLLRPSWLLGQFELRLDGSAAAAGRPGYRIVGTPRRAAPVPGGRPAFWADHVEAIVDAELGILLRCEQERDGAMLTFHELSDIRPEPPGAAGPAQFEPPPGSVTGERYAALFDGPGWRAAKVMAGTATAGLGLAIKLARRHQPAPGAGQETVPLDEEEAAAARAAQAGDAPAVGDDLLHLLYRGGLAGLGFAAEFHEWLDEAGLNAEMRSAESTAGIPGLGRFADALASVAQVSHRVTRIRVAAIDRYRIDYLSGLGQRQPRTVACDGEHRWRDFGDHVGVGPAAPLPYEFLRVAVGSWLLGFRLSGGAAVSAGGRPGLRVGLAADPTAEDPWPARSTWLPAAAVVDADLGILLSLAEYRDGRPTCRLELRDVTVAGPQDPANFRIEVRPGTRTVRETGGLLDTFDAPEPLKLAVRTGGEMARRAGEGAAAVTAFLDRGRGRDAGPGPRRPG